MSKHQPETLLPIRRQPSVDPFPGGPGGESQRPQHLLQNIHGDADTVVRLTNPNAVNDETRAGVPQLPGLPRPERHPLTIDQEIDPTDPNVAMTRKIAGLVGYKATEDVILRGYRARHSSNTPDEPPHSHAT